MQFKLNIEEFCNNRDLLQWIIENTEDTSIQHIKAKELRETFSKISKTTSYKNRIEILKEDLLRSPLVQQRIQDIGHLL